MRTRVKFVSTCLLVLSVLPRFALSANCSGPVNGFYFSNDGSVVISIASYGWWPLCNVNQSGTWAGITVAPDTCKTWVASLMAAQRAGSNVLIQHNAVCTSPSWTAPGIWGVTTYP